MLSSFVELLTLNPYANVSLIWTTNMHSSQFVFYCPYVPLITSTPNNLTNVTFSPLYLQAQPICNPTNIMKFTFSTTWLCFLYIEFFSHSRVPISHVSNTTTKPCFYALNIITLHYTKTWYS